MKKFVVLLLTLVFLVSLIAFSGCAKKKEEAPPAETTTAPAETAAAPVDTAKMDTAHQMMQ